MTFWHTTKSEGDDIQLEEIETFHIPKRDKFGDNTAIPTPHQKKMWKSLTIPGTKASAEWNERARQSRESILAKYGRDV